MTFSSARARRALKRRVAIRVANRFANRATKRVAKRLAMGVATCSALALTSVLHAQPAPVATLPAISVSGDAPSPTLLEPTTTGNLLGLTPFETPASIEIISNEQLRARGATTVTDAITQAAGISAMRHPGNGGSSLSSRGFTDSNSVAQLHDGVRQYGGVGQTFMYDPWAVDRIEVLRGPRVGVVRRRRHRRRGERDPEETHARSH